MPGLAGRGAAPSPPRCGPGGRAAGAVGALLLGGAVLVGTGVIDLGSKEAADREACQTADTVMRAFGASRAASNAREEPSGARQAADQAEDGFRTAAELAGSDRVWIDLEFAAGFFADVSESLRYDNLGLFLRLSNESQSAADRVSRHATPF